MRVCTLQAYRAVATTLMELKLTLGGAADFLPSQVFRLISFLSITTPTVEF